MMSSGFEALSKHLFPEKISCSSVYGDCDNEISVRWGCTLFVLMRGLCFFFFCRYDVELYQRIEQLIGKKLPLYPTVEEEVMLLMERVTEAQRYAKMVRGCRELPSGFLFLSS